MTQLPTPYIGSSTFARVAVELDRVYPREGVAVPLCALRRRHRAASPCATVALTDLAALTIADVVLVPGARQINCAARVSVRAHTDALVNAEVLQRIRRHPRLRACAHLHSHPFARGHTSPSRGPAGDVEGHMLPLLERNRRCNLETSFSFIACRDPRDVSWLLHAFALDGRAEVVDLGPARVLDDDSPQLRSCLLGPLRRRDPQRQLLRRWRRGLRRAGRRFACDELFDGWLRVVIDLDAGRAAVILLPPELPFEPPQVHVVQRSDTGASSHRLSLPVSLATDGWARVADHIEKELNHGTTAITRRDDPSEPA